MEQINYPRLAGGCLGILQSIDMYLTLEGIRLPKEQAEKLNTRIKKDIERIRNEAKLSDSEYYDLIRNEHCNAQ